MMTQTDPPGLDLAALADWIPGAIPGAGVSLSAELIAGGKSNLTYTLTDGSQTWILRRPPLGHVLPTAHDMAREFRVMSALADTDVPVPHAYALCTDVEVIGAPFYLMERVLGTPYRWARELAPLGTERTRAISQTLIDTLTHLHAVDPNAVGLADFGRAEGYLGRQVERWHKQMVASTSRDLPDAARLYDALAADVPPESAAGIVHGDYRLDNVLVDESDHAVAVIDWEMATLGDPLSDLALMLVYNRLAMAGGGSAVTDVATAPGFLSEADNIDRYQQRSDRDLSRFGFYLALASYKLATIAEGIYLRHTRGQTVGAGFDRIGEAVPFILGSGLDSLSESY